VKHDFLKAKRADKGLQPGVAVDDIKLSFFKMICVGILLGAGKRAEKAHTFERLVNAEAAETISWCDREMIDAINSIVFIGTILICEVTQLYYSHPD
jgi:hypothetical protein